MCRSIKTLRRADVPATETEMQAAALQYVRKVSGYRAPSRANQAAFDRAVEEIAASTQRLLDELVTPAGKAHDIDRRPPTADGRHNRRLPLAAVEPED
jgi:hypothetical protein